MTALVIRSLQIEAASLPRPSKGRRRQAPAAHGFAAGRPPPGVAVATV